ncbi:hypothetical protein NL676_022210 [Syzygium grande]|nr:hypothetical protein NL676_022210 [Syzygium grande]
MIIAALNKLINLQVLYTLYLYFNSSLDKTTDYIPGKYACLLRTTRNYRFKRRAADCSGSREDSLARPRSGRVPAVMPCSGRRNTPLPPLRC